MKVAGLPTKFGTKEVNILHHKSGILYREDSCDLLTIRECFANYSEVRVNDRIVLDLGANIGVFSYMALIGGASKVISIEPEKYNWDMLCRNLAHFEKSERLNGVVTSSDEKYLPFYVGTGKGAPSMASLSKTRGRMVYPVNNINVKTLFEKTNPNTIKIDIEGGEYDIIDCIPDSCDEITLEWHGIGLKNKKLFSESYVTFMDKGWKIVYEKKREFYKNDFWRNGLDKKTRTGGIPNFVIDAHYRR